MKHKPSNIPRTPHSYPPFVAKITLPPLPSLSEPTDAMAARQASYKKTLFDGMLADVKAAGLPDYAAPAVTERLSLIAERITIVYQDETAGRARVAPLILQAISDVRVAILCGRSSQTIALPPLPVELQLRTLVGKTPNNPSPNGVMP